MPEVNDAAAMEYLRKMPCAECGRTITWPGYTKGEMQLFGPVYCSRGCAEQADPANLTKEKLDNMLHWLATHRLFVTRNAKCQNPPSSIF